MPLQPVDTLPEFPRRESGAHKGTYGKVLLVGGSRGMAGSISLAGMAALRAGAGLVYIAVPDLILETVASFEPAYLTHPLPDDGYRGLATAAAKSLWPLLDGKDAVGIGPGLGQTDSVQTVVAGVYEKCELPMVVDADALNVLSFTPDRFGSHAAPRVLTPHPGEFARLIDSDIKTVQQKREELAAEFAAAHDVVLVLKGKGTVITDGRRIAINRTGNPGMATGGTGDVLTGILTALLGQGMEPFEAAQFGTHLHGLAGDVAVEATTQPALLPSDLVDHLPGAWRVLLG